MPENKFWFKGAWRWLEEKNLYSDDDYPDQHDWENDCKTKDGMGRDKYDKMPFGRLMFNGEEWEEV